MEQEYEAFVETMITSFIDCHQEFFDDIFADDYEYQNAQRDIGEIEYISYSNPEEVIYNKQYAWCKEHIPEVIISVLKLPY